MQIIVSGKHLDIGEMLRLHAEEKVTSHIKKYFDNAVNASVTISKNHDTFHTNIIVNEGSGTGIVIKSHADHYEPYVSVDMAIVKMEHQLRRYKEKIKNHKKHSNKDTLLEVKKYVFSSKEEFNDDGTAPTIVAEHQLDIRSMSVGDAVMYMDLQHLQAYLFINKQNNHLSMVYYRTDGNIAWVDSGFSCKRDQ